MAENVRALLDLEGSDGRIALWAHNAHVAKSGEDSMGQHLDQWFGKQYVVFGFAFGNGSFQAMGMSGHAELRDFIAPQPSVGSLDETLLRMGLPLFALNPSGITSESEAGRWLNQPHGTRSIGAIFREDPEDPTEFMQSVRILKEYDVLLFVAETTAARPNPDCRRLPPEEPSPPAPAGISDYATTMVDGLPCAWTTRPRRRRIEYETIVEGGKACLRREGIPSDSRYGVLIHEFSAAQYRGKRICLMTEGRAVVTGEWDCAHLWIAARKDESKSLEILAFAATLDEPWARNAWENRRLEMAVPLQADTIAFALVLVGNGSAWVRSIRIELVP